MNIPVLLKKEMKDSMRVHTENNLESRIKFILKVSKQLFLCSKFLNYSF